MKQLLEILFNIHVHTWELQREVNPFRLIPHWFKPEVQIFKCKCGKTKIKRGDFTHIL